MGPRKTLFNAEFLSHSLLAAYIFGFLLWNSFLGLYGFFEFNLLQTRFISAGFTFLIPLGLICFWTGKSLDELLKKRIYIACLFLYFIFYLFLIFPLIPQAFGGAAPFPVHIIGSSEQIEFLNKFNLVSVPDSRVETIPVCEIYSNDEVILFGASSFKDATMSEVTGQRVMILHQTEIKGTQPVAPALKLPISVACGGFHWAWGDLSLLSRSLNLFRGIIGR